MNLPSLRFLSTLRILFAAGTAWVCSSLTLPAAPARPDPLDPLSTHGAVIVNAAGPYVERGTSRIQVLAKLGEPSARLKDGTWLYERYRAREATLKGTLVVRFRDGRVQHLALATPATVAALRASDRTGLRQLAGGR